GTGSGVPRGGLLGLLLLAPAGHHLVAGGFQRTPDRPATFLKPALRRGRLCLQAHSIRVLRLFGRQLRFELRLLGPHGVGRERLAAIATELLPDGAEEALGPFAGLSEQRRRFGNAMVRSPACLRAGGGLFRERAVLTFEGPD